MPARERRRLHCLVLKAVRDPNVSLERIRKAWDSLGEEDRVRLGYVSRALALES